MMLMNITRFAVLLPVWLAWTVVCLLAMVLDAGALVAHFHALSDAANALFGRCMSIQGAIGRVMLGGRW